MAYKNLKPVEFTPSHSVHDDLARAQARKTHYESELLRIQCAKVLQEARDEGKPIQVQGNQND